MLWNILPISCASFRFSTDDYIQSASGTTSSSDHKPEGENPRTHGRKIWTRLRCKVTLRNSKPKYPQGMVKTDGSKPEGDPKSFLSLDLDSRPRDLTKLMSGVSELPLAAGGYGEVYKGTISIDGKLIEVAVKTIKMFENEKDLPQKERRLRREIEVWLRLDHINVLPLLGISTNFGQLPALICPWLSNGSLTTYLEHRGDGLTPRGRLGLLLDVASGLQYLHSKSIVHGDLSGSNVLIDGEGRACIADFGLSTLLTELESPTFATTFREKGTLHFAAPELFSSPGPQNADRSIKVVLTQQSDVYSFGGIMLLVLTGNMPYSYYTTQQVLMAISQGQTPRRPSDFPILRDSRWSFIQRCWANVRDGGRRPSDEEIVEFIQTDMDCAATETVWNLIGSREIIDLTPYIIRGSTYPVTSGVYGDVYKATLSANESRSLGASQVSVKVVRTYFEDERKEKRFRREIKVLHKLDHPNILPLLGTTMGFGRLPAIVSPWADHGSLKSYLTLQGDALPLRERLGLILDIANGLHYLHSRSIVHGDLSDSSVLVRGNVTACIADLMAMISTELGASTSAASFKGGGTSRFAAPELFDIGGDAGSTKVFPTTQSDIYSFGGVMLLLLTGRVPYHYYDKDILVLGALLRGRTPQRPDSTLVTDRRWSFISRCWAAAQDRPGSEELVEFVRRELEASTNS